MDGQLHIVSVNQDPKLSPECRQGAAIQLSSMRRAFRQLGAHVTAVDEGDARQTQAKLEKAHSNRPVNLIYERYKHAKSSAAGFAASQGIPYALEVNASSADVDGFRRVQIEKEKDKRQDRIIFGTASCIRAVSSTAAKYAKAHGGRGDAITICPNGVDTSLFKMGAHGQRRSPHRPPKDRFVLGFHGRNKPGDGFEMLVDVTRTLLARSYPVHLFVIGAGSFRELAKLPPCSYTRMGWVEHEDMPAYISTFDAVALTSVHRSSCHESPLKLFEGMACGAVPAVPAIGDLPVHVKHGVTGLVYPPGDSAALIEQIVSLVTNRDQHRKMSKQAAVEARAFEWKGIAGMVLEHMGLWPNDYRMGVAISR